MGQMTLQQAIALRPDYPEAHYNLGHSLKKEGLLDAAVMAFCRVAARKLCIEQATDSREMHGLLPAQSFISLKKKTGQMLASIRPVGGVFSVP